MTIGTSSAGCWPRSRDRATRRSPWPEHTHPEVPSSARRLKNGPFSGSPGSASSRAGFRKNAGAQPQIPGNDTGVGDEVTSARLAPHIHVASSRLRHTNVAM
jgi:hypothetical protein